MQRDDSRRDRDRGHDRGRDRDQDRARDKDRDRGRDKDRDRDRLREDRPVQRDRDREKERDRDRDRDRERDRERPRERERDRDRPRDAERRRWTSYSCADPLPHLQSLEWLDVPAAGPQSENVKGGKAVRTITSPAQSLIASAAGATMQALRHCLLRRRAKQSGQSWQRMALLRPLHPLRSGSGTSSWYTCSSRLIGC